MVRRRELMGSDVHLWRRDRHLSATVFLRLYIFTSETQRDLLHAVSTPPASLCS